MTEACSQENVTFCRSYSLDIEQKIYGDWSNWWFPTTRCLEVILVDSGFSNVACELKRHAFSSHRRIIGRAEANPANSDPGELKHEHWVAMEEPTSGRLNASRFNGLLLWLPPSLHQTAKRVRRAVRRLV